MTHNEIASCVNSFIKKRYDTNLLRAIAILLIFNSHIDAMYPYPQLGTGGALGNGIFFFLSGYSWVITAIGFGCTLMEYFLKDVPTLFALPLVLRHTLFFTLGMLYIHHRTQFWKWIYPFGLLGIICWVGSIVLFFQQGQENYDLYRILAGTAVIPAALFIYQLFFKYQNAWWRFIRNYTFPIYLMNTLSIGIIKGISFRFLGFDYHTFWILAPFLITAGVLIPILTKRWLLPWFPPLNRIIR